MSGPTEEKIYRPMHGWGPLTAALAALLGGAVLFITGIAWKGAPLVLLGVLAFLAGIVTMFGFMAIAPNQSRGFLLFGKYIGTATESGFF